MADAPLCEVRHVHDVLTAPGIVEVAGIDREAEFGDVGQKALEVFRV